MRKARGDYVKAQIQQANADPILALCLELKGGANNRADVAVRAQLLSPATFGLFQKATLASASR